MRERQASEKLEGLEILDNADARRYEARLDGQLAGWVDYGRVQTRLVALHTEVPPEFGGRGVASALIRRVLDDARAAGQTVTPRCPLFASPLPRATEERGLS